MKSRITTGIAFAAAAALSLAACSAGTEDPSSSPTTSAPTTTDAPTTPAAGTDLMAADSALGSIVVDGEGNVVYQYDADTQGADASACGGGCLSNWPPVHGGADAASLDGVTGEVGSITGADGKPQLTLNGWPLYYFGGDGKPGDTNGQGVGGVWWVVTPAGEPVHN